MVWRSVWLIRSFSLQATAHAGGNDGFCSVERCKRDHIGHLITSVPRKGAGEELYVVDGCGGERFVGGQKCGGSVEKSRRLCVGGGLRRRVGEDETIVWALLARAELEISAGVARATSFHGSRASPLHLPGASPAQVEGCPGCLHQSNQSINQRHWDTNDTNSTLPPEHSSYAANQTTDAMPPIPRRFSIVHTSTYILTRIVAGLLQPLGTEPMGASKKTSPGVIGRRLLHFVLTFRRIGR